MGKLIRAAVAVIVLFAVSVAQYTPPAGGGITSACTNQVITGLNGSSAPTCSSVSNAMIAANTINLATKLDANALPLANTMHYGVMVTKANTSVNNTTDTLISFDTEVRDDGGFWVVGAPTKLIVPSGGDGWYVVTALLRWDSNGTNSRFCHVKKNGNFLDWTTGVLAGASGGTITSVVVYLVATDYLEVDAYQDSGGARTINTSTFSLARVN